MYVICAILLFLFFRVEDNLKEEQAEIEKRNNADLTAHQAEKIDQ